MQGTNPDLLVLAISELGRSEDYFPRPAKIITKAKQIARDRVMTGQITEASTPSDDDRAKVAEIVREFSEKMGWGS